MFWDMAVGALRSEHSETTTTTTTTITTTDYIQKVIGCWCIKGRAFRDASAHRCPAVSGPGQYLVLMLLLLSLLLSLLLLLLLLFLLLLLLVVVVAVVAVFVVDRPKLHLCSLSLYRVRPLLFHTIGV
ncbi:unnamed protein product [Polarella glacialis]|uniref:Uncharacterized protein n=1 Tax=Polarella glacialis TaxID=89957 RepID=A0A813ICQ3_POLGL|nr:unnamed protein product [Polarella glacialis]CAE8648482.1 unnamed protein product [Polarella glacialis]